MTEEKTIKSRLYFIDIARSIAILLMLEGHFVDDSLLDSLRDNSDPIYSWWKFIRGFTSAIFLTVTGLVFTYLLLNDSHVRFWKSIRVKKGLKRAMELIFWGYLLDYYSFHVLQCIGIGILVIILLYGLSKLLKFIPLWMYYTVGGILLFISYLYFGQLPDNQYWPVGASSMIQNIFHGKRSEFPITPQMGFTMFGAVIGVLIYKKKEKIKTLRFIVWSFILGLLLWVFSMDFLLELEKIPLFNGKHLYSMDWLFEKLGVTIMLLSTLLALEVYILNIKKTNLFLKIGQNTLPIYVIHSIILYGSLTRFGLTDLIHRQLNGYEIVPLTLLFMTIFVVLTYYIDNIRVMLSSIILPIKKISNRWFGIK